MLLIASLLLLIPALLHSAHSTCADHVFLGCVLRLKAQRVPFEKNIVNVVFNIGTEARLLHTCKVYGSTLPCFREKVLECGDDRQRRVLNEVGKMLMFLCSPFSLYRQKQLIQHQECIRSILNLPATTGCDIQDTEFHSQLVSCRKVCTGRPTNFICLMKTWISEQNVCTLNDIDSKCGAEAALFYKDMQTTVFDPAFPVLCEIEPEEIIFATTTTTEEPTTQKSTQKPKAETHKSLVLKRKHKKPARTNPMGENVVFGVAPAKVLFVNESQRFTPASTQQPVDIPKMPHFPPVQIPQIEPVAPDTQKSVPSLVIWQNGNEILPEEAHNSATEEPRASTPRSVQVMSLIKSWLPSKLPGFDTLFQLSGDATTSSSTTTITTTTTTTPTSRTTVEDATISLPRSNYQYNAKQYAPARRWRPWYMSGGENWL